MSLLPARGTCRSHGLYCGSITHCRKSHYSRSSCLAVLSICFIVALVANPIRQSLYPVALLLKIDPLSFIPEAIRSLEDASTVQLPVLPLALVGVSARQEESALAFCAIVLPLTFVLGTVCVNQSAPAFFCLASLSHLPCVHSCYPWISHFLPSFFFKLERALSWVRQYRS